MRLKEFLQVGGYTNDIDNKWNTMSVDSRANYVKNDLLRRGYSPNQAAAILGNLLQENRSLGTHTENTSSGALGIAQWLGSRKKNIKAQNKHSTISGQLDFLDQEIRGKGAWTNNVGGKNAFFGSDDVEHLTKVFRKDFERPGEHEANDSRRISNAYAVLGQKYIPGSTGQPQQVEIDPDPTSGVPKEAYTNLQDWNNLKEYAKKNPTILNTFNVDTQNQFAENIRLENERIQQENNKALVEQENQQIQLALQEKQRMRKQILSMVPQAQSINSGNITPQMQNGGTIDYMQYGGMGKNGAAAYDFNDIKQMQLTYMQSPEYAKRLKNNGYDNYLDTKLRRIVDVNAVSRVKEPTNNPVGVALRKVIGYTPESFYNSGRRTEVNLSRQQAEDLGVKPSTIVSHELGHAETRTGLSGMEEEMLLGSIRPEIYGSPNIPDHDVEPEEIKSDINALRYMLYKTGKFDPKTGKWNTKDGRFDPSMMKGVKGDFSTQRLRTLYNDDELKYIMDNIAQNDTQNNNNNNYA